MIELGKIKESSGFLQIGVMKNITTKGLYILDCDYSGV